MEAILRCRFVYIYPHPGACTLRINLKPLQLTCHGCKSSLSLFTQSYHSFNLKLFEFSSMGATPARPEGVCLSVFLFVHNVWQLVAWDTCSRINLQGLPVYEKHPLLWLCALCSQFTHRSESFEPNSGCGLMISAQRFSE